jgi:hypothetical protein
LVLVRLGTLRICAPNNRLTLAFGACWSRMHSTLAWAFQDIASHHDRTPRSMCIAQLIRTLVLRVIRLARIAESTLTCGMSDCLALGTDAIRTRGRVSTVSRSTHTVQYFGQFSHPVACAAEPQ